MTARIHIPTRGWRSEACTTDRGAAQASVRINVTDEADAVAKMQARWRAGDGFLFFTLNLDHLAKLRRSAAFRDLYAQATLVSADGWPVAALARLDNPAVTRTTGADLILPACRAAAASEVPVYLFGSSAAVLDTASQRLREFCPGLDIAGSAAPPQNFDPRSDMAVAYAKTIAASGARLCLVALGAPAQEAFSAAARSHCPAVGFMGIGASLDFIAGAQQRAPRLVRTIGMEWAWRWVSSPRRLTVRYLQCLHVVAELAGARLLDRLRATRR